MKTLKELLEKKVNKFNEYKKNLAINLSFDLYFILFGMCVTHQMTVINPVTTITGLIICFVFKRTFSSLLKEIRCTIREYFIDVKPDIVITVKDFLSLFSN